MDDGALTRTEITRLLGRIGTCLILLAAIRFLGAVYPLEVAQPLWHLKLTSELVSISPVLLTGLAMQLIASRMVFDQNPEVPLPWQREQWLMRRLAFVFALVIPMQIGATLVLERRLESQQNDRLQAVHAQLISVRRQRTLPNRQLILTRLQRVEDRLLEAATQTNRRRFALFMDSLRICASAALMVWLLSRPLLRLPA